MDNIQVDESPNTKINKKKKSKLSTDMTDAGPSENSIEHSDANIIKPKKSFWKSIFRFKSRKQEMPESVVADMRRNAMKAPNLDTIFEEQEDSDISDSDSKVTEKTNTSWIPLKDADQASSKFESTTDEFLVDDSLSSEEEIPKEKIMLPEGNADKILKEIQAQLKKGKAKKLKDELKSDSDQTSTITKEDYSFEYSGSSGQSLDEEEKANRIIDQNKELVESLVNQLDTNSSKPESIELSQHASKEVVAKLSEKKVTFLPAPFEDLPDVVADATFEPTQMLSEDIMPSPNGSFGAEEQLDAKTTPEGPVATVVPFQQEEESTAATSDPGPHPSSLDPSAPSEDLYSLNSNKEKQVEQPSSQQQQFSATDMTRPPTNLNNNNNNNTHAISTSISTLNDDDVDDEDNEQDWRHLFEDVEEHQMHQRLAPIKSVESSESINEIEVWCQDLNEMASKQLEVVTRKTAQQSIPTHPEELQAPNNAHDFQKTLLPLQEYGIILSSDEASDKTYGTLNEQTAIFSQAFMYNFQAPSALDFSFPLKDGREELSISTRTMEEKGDIRLDKFFKMIFDHASQNYIVVYDPIPTELPSSALVPRGKERCKVTRKRKIMSLLHDKRVYDEYLKEFEATEQISVDSTDRESKINLLLLEGSGTQVSSFGRSFGNSSTSDLRQHSRNDFNSPGSDEAGPSKGFRPTKSLDDLCKNSKNYFVPSNSPSKPSGASSEATTSALCTAMSVEEPGISVVLEHTRKKLMNFISNHSERSSTEQLNSLYPNNYRDRFNISAGIHIDEDDQIDQISLDSIMSGFDQYDQVDQLTSVTSLEAYHTEKIETFETVEQDVRTLINELLIQVDELKEDCINAGVDRSLDGSLFGDITAKLSGAVAQNVLDEIIERTFQVSKVQNTNDASGCDLSGDRLKADDSKSQVMDNRDMKTPNMENQNVNQYKSMDESVQENALLTEERKFVPSAEPHLEPISSCSFIKNFSHLKEHPTTITIETNSEKQVFLKNHCSLKEGLQKTAGFLTSIYSELCEYNPVSYLMHQSITPKLEPEPPEAQESEPTVEATLEQPDVEAPVTVSEQIKSGPAEIELLEEAAGFSNYYANKSIDVQDSEQCEQVISIQNNEQFVINQVNVEDPQPQSSSWATKCTKVTKDFKYLHPDKDAIKATEKFRFMAAKDDAEIDQKLLYTFDGNTPRSDLNLSFLEHETDTDSEYILKTSGKLQDQNFEIANSSKEERPQVRARRGSISEERRPTPESESEQDFSSPTDLNVSKEHAHVKFAIPAIADPAIYSTYIEDSDLEFPSDPDHMNSFRYMCPSQNAGFSISSSSIDPELNYPSLAAIDEDLADHVQSSHVVHFAPLSTDPGSGEMSESSSFFTHTLNTAESFIKRLEDTVYSENLAHQGEVGIEMQVAGPSNVTILMQKQFSAGSGQSEDTGNQLTLTVLHQDMVSISGNSSIEHEGDKDAVATPQQPGHLQLERKTPEMDLPTVEKDMHHKIEEDLRSFQESINQIVDVNKKTISIINSSQISSPNDSISIVSSGGLIQTSSVEDPGPEKGNCHQTSVNKLDAPLLDSFQPRLNPTNISSSASSSSHLSFAQQDSEEQSSTQDDPLSEQGIDEASLMQLPTDDFVAQARQIREQIAAKLKKKKEEDILQKDTVVEIQKDENHASTSTTQMSKHSEDAADAFAMDEAVFKEMLQNEEIQVNLKKSRARRDLSSCCMLKVQNLDLENGEIQRTSKKTNLIDEMLVKEQQRSTELDAEELSTRLQSDTMAAFQQKNSCFYVGTQIDEICNEMGRLCLSADSEKVPVNNFNFGLRKSQIFKGELDKRVKVSFGECGSSSSADNAASASCCSKMCDNEEHLTRTPIDKSIEE